MKHIADLSPLPTPAEGSAPPAAVTAESLSSELDDELVAYVLEAQLGFDLLRRAATLLAGLMVLAAAGVRGARGHPMLAQAQEAAAEAAASLTGSCAGPRGPSSSPSDPRRRGLRRGVEAGAGVPALERGSADSILPPLRAASASCIGRPLTCRDFRRSASIRLAAPVLTGRR